MPIEVCGLEKLLKAGGGWKTGVAYTYAPFGCFDAKLRGALNCAGGGAFGLALLYKVVKRAIDLLASGVVGWWSRAGLTPSADVRRIRCSLRIWSLSALQDLASE